MKIAWIWRVGVALGLLLLVLLAVYLSRPTATAAVEVAQTSLVRTLQFSARVATLSRVDIGATVTGRVVQVAVREGAQVKADEPLVQLEDAETRAALAQAVAASQQAQARLAGLRSGSRDAAAAGVAQAEAQWLAATSELRRTRELVDKGFLGQARLDEAQRALAVATAQRDAARAAQSGLEGSGSDIAQAQAQLIAAQAAREAAQARLEQAVLRAPTAGRVLARSVEPGQIVQPGRSLLTLALAGPLELVAQVDERFLQELQIGQSAAVLADAFPTQRFVARLARISPLVDAQRGAVELHFDVPQPPAFLREDMSLSVEVTTGERQRTQVLPLSAMRGANDATADRNTVWRVRDGRVQAVPIALGLRTLAAVEVLQGLDNGDTVLLGPAPGPGARVRPVLQPADKTLPEKRAGVSNGEGAAKLGSSMGR